MAENARLISTVGWALSLLLLIIGVVISSRMILHRSTKRRTQPWYILGGMVFLAIYAFILSQDLSGISPTDTPKLGALLTTIQMFLLNGNLELEAEAVEPVLGSLSQFYLAYNAFLYLLAPLMTVSGALIVLARFVSLPMLWFKSRRGETYLISNVSEDSLAIAKGILDRYESKGNLHLCTIALANVAACDEEDLVAAARDMRLLCLNQPIFDLLTWCHKGAHLRLVLTSPDEATNLQDAIVASERLAQSDKHHVDATIHVMAPSGNAESFIDTASHHASEDGVHAKVRVIDRSASIIERMLLDYPLFLDQGTDHDPYQFDERRILIVGNDELCFEFLKAAIWCGRIDGAHFAVDVISDIADDMRERLAFQCPEIYHEISPDVYDVTFHQMQIESEGFYDLMRELGPSTTYVFIADGDDLRNTGLAKRLRELLEACRFRAQDEQVVRPLVLTAINNPTIAQSLTTAATSNRQSYDIITVGSDDETFSFQNVFAAKLDRLARNLNRSYWGIYETPEGPERAESVKGADESFEGSEYNRTSSRASAIFLKYDLFSFCRHAARNEEGAGIEGFELPDATAWTQSIDSPELEQAVERYTSYVTTRPHDWLMGLEHDRWMAFIRSIGFEDASEQEFMKFYPLTKKTQHQLARLHICLVPFDDLEEVDEMLAKAKGSRGRPFKEVDEVVIKHLSDIAYDRS